MKLPSAARRTRIVSPTRTLRALSELDLRPGLPVGHNENAPAIGALDYSLDLHLDSRDFRPLAIAAKARDQSCQARQVKPKRVALDAGGLRVIDRDDFALRLGLPQSADSRVITG